MSIEIIGNETYETIPKKVLAFKFKETFKFNEASLFSLKGDFPFWFHLMILKGDVIIDGFTHFIVKHNIDGETYLDFHDGDYIVSEGDGGDNVMVYTPNEFKKKFRKVN